VDVDYIWHGRNKKPIHTCGMEIRIDEAISKIKKTVGKY
jgi:hypothetical protein